MKLAHYKTTEPWTRANLVLNVIYIAMLEYNINRPFFLNAKNMSHKAEAEYWASVANNT